MWYALLSLLLLNPRLHGDSKQTKWRPKYDYIASSTRILREYRYFPGLNLQSLPDGVYAAVYQHELISTIIYLRRRGL